MAITITDGITITGGITITRDTPPMRDLLSASGQTAYDSAATSYIGIWPQGSNGSLGTTFQNPGVAAEGGYDSTVPLSTWTSWTQAYLIFQMLGTPTSQWN